MGWSCSACTYFNALDSGTQCAICQTTRKAPRSSSASQKNGGSKTATATTTRSTAVTSAIQEVKVTKKRQTTLFGTLVAQENKRVKQSSKTTATQKSAISNDIKTNSRDDLSTEKKQPAKSTSATLTSATMKNAKTNDDQNLRVVGFNSKQSSLATYKTLQNIPFSALKEKADKLMREVFGVSKLRYLQPKAIECALRKQSQIVIMATGGGKSLCFQLPALVLGGTTIVISPLKALIADQVQALLDKKIDAAFLSSQLSEGKKLDLLERLLRRSLRSSSSSSASNNNKIKSAAAALQNQPPVTLLYCTPEQIKTERFRSVLQEMHEQQRLTSFAVDEAHCISEWGHDFRTAYRQQMRWLRDTFPSVPLMACTATATPHVIRDITEVLRFEKEPCHVGSFDRSNLYYQVRYKETLDMKALPNNNNNNNISQGGALGDLINFIKDQHNKNKDTASRQNKSETTVAPCNGIVYVHKQTDTLNLAKEISKETGIKAIAYHGGMKDADRLEIQQAWMSGEAPIAVATVAFGMGIDLAHVRYVVHWTLSKSLEAFYQESGRAGRDGLPSVSLMYFSREEASRFQYLASQQKKEPERALGALEMMVKYCMKPGCRRKYLLTFFGETCTEPRTVCRGNCDYCRNPEVVTKSIEAASACNDFSFHTRKSTSNDKWDGQWDAPHGDGNYDNDDDDWNGEALESDGLLIRSSGDPMASESCQHNNKGRAGKKSVKSLLDKYEAIECLENQKNGFVSFRSRVKGGVTKNEDEGESSERKATRGIVIPEHLRKDAPDPMQHFQNAFSDQNKPEKKSSKDLAADASRLQEELAKVQAAKEALLLKLKTKRMAPPPPPPPAMEMPVQKRERRPNK
ncbi:hypothetical protein ACA910_012294 [Epithemia clementina (nom. ined.)]